MTKDFFEFTSENVKSLNDTELKLFDFVVKNMDRVKQMSIRMFAHECFISTTTVFRFVKKLGFLGYNQFIAMLQLTDDSVEHAVIPQTMKNQGYREEYLKNIIETVRVLKKESVDALKQALLKHPKIYILAYGLTVEVAKYARHIFLVLGYDAELVSMDYQVSSLLKRIATDDLVFVLSYTGANKRIIDMIEHIKRHTAAKVVSLTRADNNMTQMMSDINFYLFADEIKYNSQDITSRISMIAILETVLYEILPVEE